ncbi:MAG: YgiQ family radical SAM protein [Clostridiales Family XIII bacterium]|jgi:radical SAM superfamily enzyme YgiQ (UPF0313 family)|nr:YgiQ family radical SAM protein [Clostridiales Family XIII bacterium]
MNDFLPVTREELEGRGAAQADFVLVSGDPYIDHPSFGTAIIGRLLERLGYAVAVLPQPDWRSQESFKVFGRPRLGFLITAGSVDSMVANYTAAKHKRRKDSLAPGGKTGLRPDRALIVYANGCRAAYKDVPIILGGIEASLRRFAHYDYWDDRVRRSVLLDAKADLLIYGMGERAITETAAALNDGFAARDIIWIPGTVVRARREALTAETIFLPSYQELIDSQQDSERHSRKSSTENACIQESDGAKSLYQPPCIQESAGAKSLYQPPCIQESAGTKSLYQPACIQESDGAKSRLESPINKFDAYAKSFVLQYDNAEHLGSKPLAEEYDDGYFVVQNPPQPPLTPEALDDVYDLPFCYDQHPIYQNEKDTIPALHEIQFSITHVRGCFGNCAFCAITAHQGRIPTGRSKDSVLREAKKLATLPTFKGYIHDVGGPTANLRGPACAKQRTRGSCTRRDCLFPAPCKNLNTDHREYTEILKAVRGIPGVKKVFVRSGIRYDYLLADKKNGNAFLKELVQWHVSGILKIAPEHVSDKVLACMRKPSIQDYEKFSELFRRADDARMIHASRKGDELYSGDHRNPKPQYLLPYFISAHPGSTLQDAEQLLQYLKRRGEFVPDQIQDFYPTPGTLATCIYYTGKDPFTGESVYVPGKDNRNGDERQLQRALLHERKPQNQSRAVRAREIIKRTSPHDQRKK